MPQPLLLADTPHLLYRAFFALPDSITDDDGHPVNALLGTANHLLWCVERYEPRAVVLLLRRRRRPTTASSSTRRITRDRPEMPDPLAHQWERAPALYEAFGWTVSASDRSRPTTCSARLAKAEVAAGGEALLFTGDRDMFQCAGDGITILLQRARQEGPERDGRGGGQRALRHRRRAQVPDFIALRGDPSDGLPGAKGIGEKTAAELLRAPRHARGGDRRRPCARCRRVRGALLERRRRAARVPRHRDAARRAARAPAGPPDRPRPRRGGGPGAGMKRLAKRLEEGATA